MAAGDILSATVLANGWQLELVIDDFVDGGSYDLGVGPKGELGTDDYPAQVKMLVQSANGYDANGDPAQLVRTIYATKEVRKAYPNQADIDEVESGGDLTIKLALSDYIYTGDTITSCVVLAGTYTDDGAGGSSNPNNETTVGTRTNNSTLAVPKVVGNWSWPGYSIVRSGESLTLRCVVAHGEIQDFRGDFVACVEFTVEDESTNTVTKKTSTPIISSGLGDAKPIVEYVAEFTWSDLSTLDAGEILTCDFKAYPFVGGASSILDTSDGVHTGLTPKYTSQYHFKDSAGVEPTFYAVCDATNGDDGTGVASATLSAAEAAPYQTIKNAIKGIIQLQRNAPYNMPENVQGGLIYLREGTYTDLYIFTNHDDVNLAKYRTIIKPHPDETGACIIDPSTSQQVLCHRLLIEGCTVRRSGANNYRVIGGRFAELDCWFKDCTISNTAATEDNLHWFSGSENCRLHFTGCAIDNARVYDASISNQTMALVRGCSGDNVIGFGTPRTFIGNNLGVQTSPSAPSAAFMELTSVSAGVNDDGCFIAFNRCYNLASVISFGDWTAGYSHGMAIIQNVFEHVATAGVMAFSTAEVNLTNVIFINNTLVGHKYNGCYLDDGTTNYDKALWFLKNNLFDDYNIKTDIFATSGNLIGNWPAVFGVAYYANIFADTTGSGAPNQFSNTDSGGFPGVFCREGGLNPIDLDYAENASQTGTGDGNGDYHINQDSAALGIVSKQPVRFDLAGVQRQYINGASGPYEYSSLSPSSIWESLFRGSLFDYSLFQLYNK